MIIDDIGSGSLTVTLYGDECEELATYLAHASACGVDSPMRADTLSGFFLAAAITCRTYGLVNLSEDVQAKIQAIVSKVTRREGPATD